MEERMFMGSKIKVYKSVPKGFIKTVGATTNPRGYSLYNNNKSRFKTGRISILIKDKNNLGGKTIIQTRTQKKTKLPPHLAKLFDTPEKRKRADAILLPGLRKKAKEEKAIMTKRGYVMRDGNWVKYKK